MSENDQNTPYGEQMKGKTGLTRIINAFGYSIDGFKAAYTEAGFRELLIIHAISIICVFCFIHDTAIKMVLIFASFFSLIVELFNTSIEAAVDHTSLERHPLAKRAKDLGSAAQYLSLLLGAILWLIALFG